MDSAPKKQPAPTTSPRTLPSLSSKRGVKGFFQEIRVEMGKVTWPTPKKTTRLTGVVAAVCVMIILILLAFGVSVEALLKFLLSGGK